MIPGIKIFPESVIFRFFLFLKILLFSFFNHFFAVLTPRIFLTTFISEMQWQKIIPTLPIWQSTPNLPNSPACMYNNEFLPLFSPLFLKKFIFPYDLTPKVVSWLDIGSIFLHPLHRYWRSCYTFFSKISRPEIIKIVQYFVFINFIL